jgi:hypothetical protein
MESEDVVAIDANVHVTLIGDIPIRLMTVPVPVQFPCRDCRKPLSSAAAKLGKRPMDKVRKARVKKDMGKHLDVELASTLTLLASSRKFRVEFTDSAVRLYFLVADRQAAAFVSSSKFNFGLIYGC